MGVVYVVEHVHTGEQLALKVLHGAAAVDPAAIARFKREARVGAQIKSENVVRVTDADVAPELGGAPFFVMELLEGCDLEHLVDRVGPLDPDVVVEVLSQLARALDKAHRIGIVHRDLKPENIFLHWREDGTAVAKILDFGISKFLWADPEQGSNLGITADGTVMGTPYYMTPEQARGLANEIGPSTDMWPIGLIAQRMLTGAIYWTARTHAELMVQILAGGLPPPSARWPEVGEAFDAWFARSCNRDAAQRWPSVSEQVSALAQATRFMRPPASGRPRASFAEVAAALHGPASDAADRRSGTPAQGAPRAPSPWSAGAAKSAATGPTEHIGSGSIAGAGILTRTAPTQRSTRSLGLVIAVVVGLGGAGSYAYRMLQAPSTTTASPSSPAPEPSAITLPSPEKPPAVEPPAAQRATASAPEPEAPPSAAATNRPPTKAVEPAPHARKPARPVSTAPARPASTPTHVEDPLAP
jgi:serine/threonine-protein kinase